MSYAAVAASGPRQSPEEVINTNALDSNRAPTLPQVERTEDSVQSLVDVDSPHVSSVPSDFESQSVKTDTQAERLQREAEARQRRSEAEKKARSAKAKAKAAGHSMKENAGNPIVLGNAITVGILGTVLGLGAYRKYTAGELTWKIAGTWAGVVGLFAVGDYYVTSYLFKKFPPKK